MLVVPDGNLPSQPPAAVPGAALGATALVAALALVEAALTAAALVAPLALVEAAPIGAALVALDDLLPLQAVTANAATAIIDTARSRRLVVHFINALLPVLTCICSAQPQRTVGLPPLVGCGSGGLTDPRRTGNQLA